MKTPNPDHPIRNTLKHLALAAMMAASIAMMPGSANAAPITWGTATTIVDDLDVSTTGTFQYAYHWASGDQTVNGVTFTGTTSLSAGGGDVGLSGFDANYFAFTSASNPFASLSTAYQATLAGSNYNSGATVTVTLNNLTVGNQYAAQVWIEDARNEPNSRFATLTSVSGNSVILDFNSTGASGELGQYSIGTFTANATTQTFTIAPSAGGSAQLNALQVRDLGATTATLSPSFSLPSGTYYGAQTVTLECATAGATIYYTTNGDTPDNTSSSGSSGLTVNVPVGTTMTINAYASAAGSSDSDIISATYTTLPIVSGTWTNSDGGPWTTATNWQDDAIAIGTGGTADFSTLTLTAATTVTLDGARTIGNLIFDDQNATKSEWTLITGSGGPLTLAVASGTPTVTSNAPTTIGAVLAGTQGLQKEGSNVLTLTAGTTYTGTTAINNGTLVYKNTYASTSHVIASGATLEFNVASGQLNCTTTTFSGAGNFVKSGNGELLWGVHGGTRIASFAMDAGSLIDVQAGKLTIGSYADDNMTNCKADLNVAAAATFNSAACDAYVDALTGAGTIILAYQNNFQRTMTVGVDNGSGTFSGALTDGTEGGQGKVVKTGSGTQTLSGTNTYTGETTISAGTLALGANDVLPNASAISIGNATLDADTFTDTVGTLDVTGAATIDLGTGTLAFAGSSAVDWTGGTLNVTGTLGATSLRFGTTSGGLAPAQLALISVNGSGLGTYTLDASGYLVTGGFDAWADANGATGQTPQQDHDNDGVENGIEYFMGETGSSFTAMPVLDETNTITWQADADYLGTYEVQTSTDLAIWTNVDPRPVPSGGTLSYLLPPGAPGGKSFVRLLVTPTP